MNSLAKKIEAPMQAPAPVEPILATRWQRLSAFFIDAVAIWVISLALAMALYSSGLVDANDEQTIKLIDRGLGKAIGLFFYFPFFTAKWSATPGKLLLKIKVVSNDNQKLSVGKVLLREMFGRWVSVIALGHFWIFFNKRKKTAWDYMANSVVVKA